MAPFRNFACINFRDRMKLWWNSLILKQFFGDTWSIFRWFLWKFNFEGTNFREWHWKCDFMGVNFCVRKNKSRNCERLINPRYQLYSLDRNSRRSLNSWEGLENLRKIINWESHNKLGWVEKSDEKVRLYPKSVWIWKN